MKSSQVQTLQLFDLPTIKPKMIQAARLLMIFGVILLVVGGLLYLLGRAGFSLGNLPGNIRIERGNFTCVFALGASILLSILLTIILNIAARFLK